MNSAREAILALVNTLNDPEVDYEFEDESDLNYTIGLLTEYTDDE